MHYISFKINIAKQHLPRFILRSSMSKLPAEDTFFGFVKKVGNNGHICQLSDQAKTIGINRPLITLSCIWYHCNQHKSSFNLVLIPCQKAVNKLNMGC